MRTTPNGKTTKTQRIKLQLCRHPVKLDGTITEFALDGSYFDVEFDGPLPKKRLYPWSEILAGERPKQDVALGSQALGNSSGNVQLWVIL